MNKVAYIIETNDNKFKGFVAILTPDTDDSALFVTHSTDKFLNVEDVRLELDTLPSNIKKYTNPIKSSENGLSWLSELEKENK